MAKIEVTTCDGCGTHAPDDYLHVFASDAGWCTAIVDWRKFDACSLDCLISALRRLRGDDVAADDLERLFAAPAARRPRKPRPPKD